MTPREPDRFDKQGDEVNRRCTHIFGATIGACSACVAAALRAERDAALERAAQVADSHCPINTTGHVCTPMEIARAIRALASPAAAPVKCKHGKPGVACDRCPWCWAVKCPGTAAAPTAETAQEERHRAMRLRAYERDEEHAVPPSEPAAPVRCPHGKGNEPCEVCDMPTDEDRKPAPLLPRVLAALESVARDFTCRIDLFALAAELRAYIAELEPAEKRIAELERKAEAWADAIEYCEYSFSPEWLVDRRNRSVFAAHIFRLLDAARAATKVEGT